MDFKKRREEFEKYRLGPMTPSTRTPDYNDFSAGCEASNEFHKREVGKLQAEIVRLRYGSAASISPREAQLAKINEELLETIRRISVGA